VTPLLKTKSPACAHVLQAASDLVKLLNQTQIYA